MSRITVVDFAGHAFGMDLALALARRGHKVDHSYCSTNLTPHGDLTSRAGVVVHAVSSGREFEKYRLGKRLLAELVYGCRTARLIWRNAPDGVVTSNVPLVSLALVAMVCRFRGSRWLFWLQDVQTGLATQSLSGPSHLAARVLQRLERSLLRLADEVVIISDDFADEVRTAGRNDFHVIANWAVLTDVPVLPRSNAWAIEQGLDDASRPIFLYAGTLGRKHPPELLVALASSLGTEVQLVVISEGEGIQKLQRQLEEARLDNVRIFPFQRHQRLAEVLATGDVLVAVLDASAGAFSVPSKILSYLCAGRPIFAAMPATNGAARLISEEARAGVVVAPTARAVSLGAKTFLADRPLWNQYASNARRSAETLFDVNAKAQQFEDLLVGSSKTSTASAREPESRAP